MKTELIQTIMVHNLNVFYSLSELTCEDGTSSYGIVVKGGAESICCSGLSAERTSVESLLNAMIRGKVTPATAQDIVEDWLLR